MTRDSVWEASLRAVAAGEVAPRCDAALVEEASGLDFDAPMDEGAMIAWLARGLANGQVHVGHPRYFGLPSQGPSHEALVAGLVASAANPQLATRRHAPFAVAVEERLFEQLGQRFGWSETPASGTFTSGGAEANLTAMIAALSSAFPEWSRRGVRAAGAEPAVYASAEAHPTVVRAARVAGLGSDAVRSIPADGGSRMKVGALAEAIGRDRSAGVRPVMVVATAGTTSVGAIDPLGEIANVAARAGAWFHVDAAWGGMLALVPEEARGLAGIERADSITFDPHKVLSVPLGIGMFLTRRPDALTRAFEERAGYMPRDTAREPYAHGLPWSRRFVGAPVYAVLATAGWDGTAATLRRRIALGHGLRSRLRARGWTVLGEGPLPVVCFRDDARADGTSGRFLDAVARAVIASGAGWLSVTRLSGGARALRAAVTNDRTREEDVDRLVDALDEARRAVVPT